MSNGVLEGLREELRSLNMEELSNLSGLPEVATPRTGEGREGSATLPRWHDVSLPSLRSAEGYAGLTSGGKEG